MSVPIQIARVSSLLQGSLLLGTMQSRQIGLLKVQQQLSTGDRLSRPSEDTAAALGIVSLKRQLSENANYTKNLDFADGILRQADAALGDVADLVSDAQGIASSQVGAGSTAAERAAQAEVVNSLIARAMAVANTKYQGQSIFAGQSGNVAAFTSVGGGYKYQGTASGQTMLTPNGGALQYTLSGDEAFGAVSSQVVGYRDLSPALTNATRLADLEGARQRGVATGPITVTIGATPVTVDLSAAATVGDVATSINTALAASGSSATVSLAGDGFTVNGDPTQNISIADAGTGTAAADLGLTGLFPSAASTAGLATGPKITATTTLASLNGGAGVSGSGFTLSNGANSATISMTGLSTVEDLVNAINRSGTNVRAEIKADGTGINLFNPLSGTALRIGENGGTTADDLGLRSFTGTTNLADLNGTTGVTPIANTLSGPTGLVAFTTTAGTVFNVRMDGITTPAGLIAAINSATGNTTVTAALNSTGNGITLTDSAGGSGNLSVTATSSYISNGSDLGIVGRSGTGGTLVGTNITLSTDDFRVTRRDGTSFTVSLKNAETVQDVINRINNADGNTTPATQVTAALNANGNGISLTDASAGAGMLTVASVNASEAAGQLGILKTAASSTPGAIAGDDVNPLMPQGLFSSLTMLRDSLLANDSAGIARAAQLLEIDGQRAIKARGVVGARDKDVAARQDDAGDEKTQLKQAFTLLNDTDFTEAASRFQLLNTAYQASLQVAQTTRNMSLIDFLK